MIDQSHIYLRRKCYSFPDVCPLIGGQNYLKLKPDFHEVFWMITKMPIKHSYLGMHALVSSDVKRGQNLEAEVEARTMRSRPMPRPKIMKKYQIMINNIWFKIIAGKINKIPEFYTIFARKTPDNIIRQRDRGQAEAKTSRPRPRPKFWPRGHFGLEDLTS